MTPSSRPTWGNGANIEPYPEGVVYIVAMNYDPIHKREVILGQSLAANPIHIIFSTKSRQPYFVDKQIRGELHAYLKSICDQLKCTGVKVGGIEDHVHIACHLSKNVAGSQLIKEIKRVSSLWIKTKGPAFRDFKWQGGYAYFAISPKDLDKVIHYIENQEVHHKKIGYQDEVRRFFRRYGVTYNEQYFWD